MSERLLMIAVDHSTNSTAVCSGEMYHVLKILELSFGIAGSDGFI